MSAQLCILDPSPLRFVHCVELEAHGLGCTVRPYINVHDVTVFVPSIFAYGNMN